MLDRTGTGSSKKFYKSRKAQKEANNGPWPKIRKKNFILP